MFLNSLWISRSYAGYREINSIFVIVYHLLFNMSSRYDLSLEEKMNLIQMKE